MEGFNNLQFLVKFTTKEWVGKFLDGSIHMNNFKHFIDQEKNSNIKGQGDDFEGAHVVEVKKINIYYQEDRLFATSTLGNMVERYERVNKIPMFCISSFNADDFVIIKQDEEYIYIKLDIPTDDIKKIKEVFKSDTVAVTNDPNSFIKQFKEEVDKEFSGLEYRMVDYVDYKVLNKSRKNRFDKGELDILFTKHDSLSYQKEFRFILSNIQSEGSKTVEIGNLRSIFAEMDFDYFFYGVGIKIRK